MAKGARLELPDEHRVGPAIGRRCGAFARRLIRPAPPPPVRAVRARSPLGDGVVNYVTPQGNKIELNWIMTPGEETDQEVVMVQDGTLPYY